MSNAGRCLYLPLKSGETVILHLPMDRMSATDFAWMLWMLGELRPGLVKQEPVAGIEGEGRKET